MLIMRITMRVLMGKQKEVMQTLVSIIGPTGREKGCLSCQVFRDIENQNIFSLLAEWNTRENMVRHIKSDRFGILLGTTSLLHEPPSIQIYTVSSLEGMEMINALRGKSTLILSV